MLGKQDNCQAAVSVSLACEQGSQPEAWQLYLLHTWAEDDVRRKKVEIPQEIGFATKPQITLQQLRTCSVKARLITACWPTPATASTTRFARA